MQTPPLPLFRAAHLGWIFALAPMSLGGGWAAEANSHAAAPATAKTHVLFMGADLFLDHHERLYPVVDVTPNYLVLEPNGKSVKVPLTETTSMVIRESLKIADTNLAVNRLKFSRAFSQGADPMEQLSRTAALAAGQSAEVDLANNAAAVASNQLAIADSRAASARDPVSAADAAAAQTQARATLDAANQTLSGALAASNNEIYDVGARSASILDEDSYDAIRVSFELTPETDLKLPYYAVIAQIRERGSKPGSVRKWAYVQSLGPMAAGVHRRVNVYRPGLPPGYILESCEVHVYNGTEELGTSLSRKRVSLSDDEAQQYRVIEHISANPGRTMAAQPFPANPYDLSFGLTSSQLNATSYVRVTKDGQVAEVFRDARGKEPLHDRTLEAALKTIRFKPALAAGKPVESLVAVKIGQAPAL